MYKLMTAAALSALIAVTPAAAQDTNQRQLNEGALAAIVIGGIALWALSQDKDDDKARHNKARHNDDVYRHTHNGSTHWHHKNERHGHHQGNWHQKNKRSKILPSQCIRRTEDGDRTFRYVQTRCLKRNDVARRLPSSCGVFGKRDGQPRAYGVRCLKQAGYTFKNHKFEARR